MGNAWKRLVATPQPSGGEPHPPVREIVDRRCPDGGTKSFGKSGAGLAATRPELNGIGDVYCEDCEVALPQAETDGSKGVAPWAMDPQAAERLWLLSEQLTGLSLGDRLD